MLGLQLSTDPRWVNIAEKSISEILIDHAFCEQKAATSGIALIVKFSDFEQVVKEVTPLVAEEWGHFRKVMKEMEKRDIKLGPARKDQYVVALNAFQNKGGSRNAYLVEKLLTFALIEARSCERFRLLSLNMEDEYMRNFYHEFMVSEAGHYRMFIELARKYMPPEYVKKRWSEYLEHESEILRSLELRGDRIH
ncbi:MAG: tRNA-(ms[2]io[6]A)-hydroxylase [Flavobacteriales bacterium]|nr:tRNA-(ms[2]io[6]A)-hydroxylase [Flavobacteriales bacterium]